MNEYEVLLHEVAALKKDVDTCLVAIQELREKISQEEVGRRMADTNINLSIDKVKENVDIMTQVVSNIEHVML